MRSRSLLSAALAATAGASAPNPAWAHDSVLGLTGFPAMVLHPLVVPEHAMGLAAAALLVTQQARPSAQAAAALVIAGLLASFAYLYWLVPFAGAHLLALAATGVLGALVALDLHLPRLVVVTLLTALGFAVGMGTLPEAQTLAHAAQMLAGVAIGSVAIVLVVAAAAIRHGGSWLPIASRILGSWIAASVLLVLALTVIR